VFVQIVTRAGVFVGLNFYLIMHFLQINFKAERSYLHIVGVVVRVSYKRICLFVTCATDLHFFFLWRCDPTRVMAFSFL